MCLLLTITFKADSSETSRTHERSGLTTPPAWDREEEKRRPFQELVVCGILMGEHSLERVLHPHIEGEGRDTA